MSKNREKLLVPIDGSALSNKILGHLEAYAPLAGTEIRLVRVVPARAVDATAPGEYQETQKDLRAAEAALVETGAAVQASLLVGDPAEQILEAAAGWKPALIAMTTHGRTGLERLVRGSVAERVLRGAEAPVLLVNPFTAASRFERILIPLDGSSLAASILPLAARIAQAHGSEVILFHAVERGESGIDALMTRAEAQALLERYQRFFADLKVRIVLAGKQPPVVEILEAIEQTKASLVVFSSHGRTGVTRWILGSVAEKVLRECRCPVLVKRAITTSADGALHLRKPARPRKQRA
jgi:nucleotide-binding universal stress UspA family protein